MNILSLFNIIPNVDLISEAEWASDIVDERLLFPGLKTITESQDESGLELALRFRDATNKDSAIGSVTLCALNIGPDIAADKVLRTLLALGFSTADRIETQIPEAADSNYSVSLLQRYCQQYGPYDLMITGAQSTLYGYHQTPSFLAEALGIPCISQVLDFTPVDEAHVWVLHQTDAGITEETLSLPLVLAIGDAPDTYLRIPTLRQRKAAGDKSVQILSAQELLSASTDEAGKQEVSPLTGTTSLLQITPVDQSRSARSLDGDLEDIATEIWETYFQDNGKEALR